MLLNEEELELTEAEIDALSERIVQLKEKDPHKSKVPRRFRTKIPYIVAEKLVRVLAPEVKTSRQYRRWLRRTRAYYLPYYPERIYTNFSWPVFLGIPPKDFGEVERKRKEKIANYKPMWEAIRWSQKYCREHGINTVEKWKQHIHEGGEIPDTIPTNPAYAYRNDGFPGMAVWCGKNVEAIQESISKVTPIITLLHAINTPQNVLQLVSWPNGVSDFKEKWQNQSDYDRIIGCWALESELVPEINRILSENGSFNGEEWTIPNVNNLTWELNSVLEMVKLR